MTVSEGQEDLQRFRCSQPFISSKVDIAAAEREHVALLEKRMGPAAVSTKYQASLGVFALNDTCHPSAAHLDKVAYVVCQGSEGARTVAA